MMASNLLSRLLPSVGDGQNDLDRMPSYPRTRRGDIEAQDMSIDEQNLNERFQGEDLERLLAEAGNSRIADSVALSPTRNLRKPPAKRSSPNGKPKWLRASPNNRTTMAHDDEDVPESLLLEGGEAQDFQEQDVGGRRTSSRPDRLPSPVPGPSNKTAKAQWHRAKEKQRLHADDRPRVPASQGRPPGLVGIDPRERAIWKWTNVQNLDKFLVELYAYFEGHGIWSIILRRVIKLATGAFVLGFTTFLTMCIDYKKLPESHALSQVVIPQCTKKMPAFANFLLWISAFSWIYTAIQYVMDLQRLWDLHNFYKYLLEIPDTDVQTVSWQIVVSRLMALRELNPATATDMPLHLRKHIQQSKQRMDAHDIANRIMRKENYLIALFNKDILDVSLPVPFIGNRQFYTRTLEYMVELCVLNFVFDDQGQIHPKFLSDRGRGDLIAAMRKRFTTAGLMSIVIAPIYVIYLFIFHFLSYFTEYRTNPSELGSRSFTPLAEWKFREFNELHTFFRRRRNMAMPVADVYLSQFPKDKTAQLMKFTAFVTGALASVLGLATLLDPNSFLEFRITTNRTVMFYLGIFITIFGATRSSVREDEDVFAPDYHLSRAIEFLHFYPAHWRDRLHTDEVRREFSTLYQYKVVILLEEVLSVIFTPFILFFRLPNCSPRIVDFFRDFTVHVDGVGHVCSFAEFDFKTAKGFENLADSKTHKAGEMGNLREEYYASKDGKMLASYYGFLDNYAANPRGARNQSKHAFHLPPAFPGMLSGTTGNIETGGLASSRHPNARQRTPRFGPAGGHVSPMHSVLLDPHHQPPMTRATPHHGAQARSRNVRRAASDLDEFDENAELPEAAMQEPVRTTSQMLDEDEELGDSWKTTRQLDGEDERPDPAEEGAGVLGLLYQFQKTQTQGRVAGTHI